MEFVHGISELRQADLVAQSHDKGLGSPIRMYKKNLLQSFIVPDYCSCIRIFVVHNYRSACNRSSVDMRNLICNWQTVKMVSEFDDPFRTENTATLN